MLAQIFASLLYLLSGLLLGEALHGRGTDSSITLGAEHIESGVVHQHTFGYSRTLMIFGVVLLIAATLLAWS